MLILFLLLRAIYIWVLFFTHIPFVVNCTFNKVLTENLQHLQQGWVKLVEISNSEIDKYNATGKT